MNDLMSHLIVESAIMLSDSFKSCSSSEQSRELTADLDYIEYRKDWNVDHRLVFEDTSTPESLVL